MSSTLFHKVKRLIDLNVRLYLRRQLPILVYSTGRVGSMSVYYALSERGLFAIHPHTLRPERLKADPGTTRWAYYHILTKDRPFKTILIIREPGGLLVSDFFPKMRWLAGSPDAYLHLSVDELCTLFTTRYFDEQRHLTKIDWLDTEFKAAMKIDLYQTPFPKEQGYHSVQEGRHEVLVITSELDDETKGQVIGNFVGLSDLKITRRNVGEQKPYGAVYKQFKQQLVIPSEYLDTLYHSKFARHFYTQKMLDGFRAEWEKTPEPMPVR